MGQLNKSYVVQRESHIGKIKFKILYTLATFVIKKKNCHGSRYGHRVCEQLSQQECLNEPTQLHCILKHYISFIVFLKLLVIFKMAIPDSSLRFIKYILSKHAIQWFLVFNRVVQPNTFINPETASLVASLHSLQPGPGSHWSASCLWVYLLWRFHRNETNNMWHFVFAFFHLPCCSMCQYFFL